MPRMLRSHFSCQILVLWRERGLGNQPEGPVAGGRLLPWGLRPDHFLIPLLRCVLRRG